MCVVVVFIIIIMLQKQFEYEMKKVFEMLFFVFCSICN